METTANISWEAFPTQGKIVIHEPVTGTELYYSILARFNSNYGLPFTRKLNASEFTLTIQPVENYEVPFWQRQELIYWEIENIDLVTDCVFEHSQSVYA